MEDSESLIDLEQYLGMEKNNLDFSKWSLPFSGVGFFCTFESRDRSESSRQDYALSLFICLFIPPAPEAILPATEHLSVTGDNLGSHSWRGEMC